MASVTSNPSVTGPLANRLPGALTLRIESPSTCFELLPRELWKYRELLFFLARQVRCKRTAIGVCTFHQNHDYGYHPEGRKGEWEGEEAQENYALLERHRKFRTLDNATHLLKTDGKRWNYRAWYVRAKRDDYDQLSHVWFHFLDWTRPLRHRIGLRQKGSFSV